MRFVRGLGIPVMVVAVALLACKKKSSSTTGAATTTPAPKPTLEAPVLPETPASPLKLNAAAKLDGVTLTISEYKDCRLSNFYSRRSLAKKKQKLVAINVLFEGNGEKEHNVSYSNFKVTDPEGMAFRSTFRSGSDCEPLLKSSRIGVGEKTKGWVVFEVPETLAKPTITFTNRRPYRFRTPANEQEQKVSFNP
ncbi:MAG: DUF4352 domain-containing protein [Polyangiaceae bacterium]